MKANVRITIGNKLLGKGPVLIVAEIGSNHGGSIKHAKDLIDAAKESGADCVKFQSFLADELVSQANPSYKVLKRLELHYRDYLDIKQHADKLHIPFFSTCTNEISLEWLKKVDIPVFKIASPNINCIPLICKVGLLGKPIFISTGMCYEYEIKKAIETLMRAENNKVVIMHCVSDYPAVAENVNVRYLERLKGFGYMVGYSDHTLDSRSSVLATALGAAVIEKHFTIKNSKRLPDSIVSLTPGEFSKFVRDIRDAERILGTSKKILTKSELRSRKISRRSIYARQDIQKGTKIKSAHLKIIRPDKGIRPQFYDDLIGCIAKTDIKTDNPIKWRCLIRK